MLYKNLKNTLIIFSFLLLLSGCSMTEPSPNKKNDFIEYDNTNHVIGDKSTAISTLVYIEKTNNMVDKKVTFYIDKFPYQKRFSLCSDKQNFKIVKSVTIDGKGNKEANYINDPIDCSSAIYLNEKGFGSYKLLFLTGFDVRDFYGFDLLLSNKSSLGSSGFSVSDKEVSQDYLHGIEKESSWHFEK